MKTTIRQILFFAAIGFLTACTAFPDGDAVNDGTAAGQLVFRLGVGEWGFSEGDGSEPGDTVESVVKSSLPDDVSSRITDVNVLVFDSGSGDFISSKSEYYTNFGTMDYILSTDSDYKVFFVANAGRNLLADAASAASLTSAVEEVKLYGNPSSYSAHGMPMVARVAVKSGDEGFLSCKFVRLFSRVRVKIDRGRLSETDVKVKGIRVCNFPKYVYPLSDFSFIRDSGESTQTGYGGEEGDAADIAALNNGAECVLYVPENCNPQWENLLPDNKEGVAGKTKEKLNAAYSGKYDDLLTYLEVNAEVHTPSRTHDNVYFRTYLGGDSPAGFNLPRNTAWLLSLKPGSDDIEPLGWRLQADTPSIGASIVLDKSEANVINGIDDVVHVCAEMPDGSPLAFSISGEIEAMNNAGLAYRTEKTTFKGRGVTSIRLSTSLPIDRFNPYNMSPDCKVVRLAVESVERFNGKPLVSKTLNVNVYHEAFPIYIKGVKEGTSWNLYAYSNNPMRLGLEFSCRTYNGYGASIVRSSVFRHTRHSSKTSASGNAGWENWSLVDEAIGPSGGKIAEIGRMDDYPEGLKIELDVLPVNDVNFFAHNPESILEYPKFTLDALYMGNGNQAYFGPGSTLSPLNMLSSPVGAEPRVDYSGKINVKSNAGFSAALYPGYDELPIFKIDGSTTGWNGSGNYEIRKFSGRPFYFINAGLTVYDVDLRNDDYNYCDDKDSNVGVTLLAWEPGRDFGIVESAGARFGVYVAVMTQFFGNRHSWERWRGYERLRVFPSEVNCTQCGYDIYTTINGCSCWPGADCSKTGFRP